jgi:peptidoglycan/xylan/chitin deacetylase (PgdA/CDA1 family)
VEGIDRTRPGLLRVLLYHRVAWRPGNNSPLNPDLITTTPDIFERQLRHLTQHYHPIDARELIAALEGRHVVPKRAVLVTFDDGYRDFLDIARPVLRAFQVPAVVFVSTAFADCPTRVFWWDAVWQMITRTRRNVVNLGGHKLAQLGGERGRAAACNQVVNWLKTLTPAQRTAAVAALADELDVQVEPSRALLSWADLRLLAAEGVTIAAHGRTHELLDQLTSDCLVPEVDGAREDLVREVGVCPPLFSYPNGNFNIATVRALARAGFAVGFTASHGINRLGVDDPRMLRRDPGGSSLLRLAVSMLGPVATIRVLRNPLPARAPRVEAGV